MSESNDNGVYYFLGNITSHALHALPLHKELGGTFVVTSNKARKTVEKLYGVPVINIDDKPYKWMMPGRKPKPIHEYIVFDKRLKKTYDFLNEHAKVVIFYELFELEKPEWLSKPKKVFLTHGNMLKSYMTMYPKRLEIIKDYDYMAALGPHMKQQFIKDGVDPSKLLDIGIARTDSVVENSGKIVLSSAVEDLLGKENLGKPIVSYAPTFWGASSIYNTGIDIVRNFPDDYVLLFRPHPQTPAQLLKRYEKYTSRKPNIFYLAEGFSQNIGLVDILKASSLIIGDVSSVMLEAILIRKPLIFAYDTDDHIQSDNDYSSIMDIVNYSQKITPQLSDIEFIINKAAEEGIDDNLWTEVIKNNFFNYSGDSVKNIINNLTNLTDS